MLDDVSKTASQTVDATKKLGPEIATLKTNGTTLDGYVREMLSDRIAKEKYIADQFGTIEGTIGQIQIDIKKRVSESPSSAQRDTVELPQALSSIRKELGLVKKGFNDSLTGMRRDFAMVQKEAHDSKITVINILPAV